MIVFQKANSDWGEITIIVWKDGTYDLVKENFYSAKIISNGEFRLLKILKMIVELKKRGER